jgi:hypothetical protein
LAAKVEKSPKSSRRTITKSAQRAIVAIDSSIPDILQNTTGK